MEKIAINNKRFHLVSESSESGSSELASFSVKKPEKWKLLIVDDEAEVHRLTRMALEDFTFEGRELMVLSALSGEEAETILREHPDIALILLDVIMETDDAGLRLVRNIRESMKNNIVQIVLRTGQPGLTPQREAISEYEINGYTSKVELTAEKMFSTVTASLRAYWLSYSLNRINLQLQNELGERKRAEKAVRRLTHFQETVIDNASIWLEVTDRQNRVVIWNKAAENISGYSRREVIGHDDILSRLYPDETEQERVRQQISKRVKKNQVDDFETIIRRKDGETRTVSWTFRELKDETRRCYGRIALGRDITEHRKLELQLRQAQKMEAVGRMAGGLAHDFNNLLTVIRGYCDIALGKIGPKDPIYSKIKQIEKAAGRAESLTRQLLSFSRHQVMTLRPVNLNALIQDMQKMLARLIGADIELRTRLDEQLGNIKADYSQLEQIIMNLVVNARDAMPLGGRILLETKNTNLQSLPLPKNEDHHPGDYIMLSITDTGCGMDSATREHIFEPFFTTKEKGKGTGLGLSTVYGIVNQCKGFITVESKKNQGTTFEIYFPKINESMEKTDKKPEVPDRLSGNETILVVEDQPEVLKLTSETLGMYGYTVLEAPNAGSALLICEEYKEKIDLLLGDVIMPRMNGVQLVKRLWKILPNLRVLFMSGYTYNIIEQQGLLEPGQNFIQKPFTAVDLLRLIRKTLDAPPQNTA